MYKKLIIIGFAFFLCFFSNKTNAQSIQSVTITSPILCFGDLATINIQLNQSSPAIILKVIVGIEIFGTFIPITSTNNTTVTNINVPSLSAQSWVIRIVDSTSYYATNPDGQNPASIYDFTTINIVQPLQLSYTTSQTSNLLCYDDCEAQSTINIYAGNPPYSISFGSGSSSLISGFDTIYSNLCAGNYNISVTDVNSCSVNGSSPTSITVNEPTELTPNGFVSSNYNGEDISCFGLDDGEITASVIGGTPPYTYSLNAITYSSSALFSGLSANGVSNPNSQLLIDSFVMDFDTITSTFNHISVTPTLLGVNYLLVVEGTYGLDFFNSNQYDAAYTIASQTSVNNWTMDGVSYRPSNDIYTNSHIYEYNFTGDGSQKSFSFSDVNYADNSGDLTFTLYQLGTTGNNYSIYYKDANGCDASETITLNNPAVLSGTISISGQVSCSGTSDGELTFQVDNIFSGTAPYTYSLNGGAFQSSPIFTGLNGNSTYYITILDANGCTFNANKFLSEPTQISFTYSTSSYNGFNISSFGLSDGSIHFQNPSGGNSPYTYSIDGSNFSTTMNYIGLSSGVYPVTVIDANGCTEVISVTLTEEAFAINLTSTQASCLGIDGTISVTQDLSIASPPWLIELQDMNGVNVQVANNVMTSTFTFYYLVTGPYIVKVTQPNGYAALDTIIVSQIPMPFNILTNYQDPPCFNNITGGSISVLAAGGSLPYQFYINGVLNTNPYPYDSVFTNLTPGIYVMSVIDANNCMDKDTVIINQNNNPLQLSFNSNPIQLLCFGDTVTSVVYSSGGTPPYSYEWFDGSYTPIGVGDSISGLFGGSYFVKVTDVNGCDTVGALQVYQMQTPLLGTNQIFGVPCKGDSTGMIVSQAIGSQGPYLYYWFDTFGDTIYTNSTNYPKMGRDTLYNLVAGTYLLQLYDAYGCTNENTITVGEPSVALSIDSIIVTDTVSCFGFNDGAAQTYISGGMPNYYYVWDNGELNSNAVNLTTGYHVISLTDDWGCVVEDSVFIPNSMCYGCTDSTAINYDSLANTDDGSCVYCNISNTFFSNNPSSLTSCDGFILSNVVSNYPIVSYSWTNSQGILFGTNNFSSNLCNDAYILVIIDSAGCTFVDTLILGTIMGCTDSLALNYNWTANSDDLSCIYPIYGCTNYLAINYDSLANIDDASCCILSVGSLQTINTSGLTFDLDTVIINLGDTIEFGSLGYHNAVEVDESTWTANDTTYNGGFYFSLGSVGGYFIADSAKTYYYVCTPHVSLGMKGIIIVLPSTTSLCFGCTDPLALNYDSTVQYNDSSCVYLSGCTDILAYNYDANAITDDGSCLYCDLSFSIYVVQNSSPPTCNGFAVVTNVQSSNMPSTYLWSTGSTQNNVTDLCSGTYTITITDNVGCTVDTAFIIGSVPIFGCTDLLSINYNPLATVDDGTCTYPTVCTKPIPTGLYVDNIIHSQAQVHWDNMSDAVCMALKYFIQVREVGTTSWTNKLAQDAGLCNFGLPTTSKMFTQLASNTTYEYRMKAAYCNVSGTSSWTSLHTFTTADDCPNVVNFTATPGPQTNKVVFSWDTTASYSFVRVKMRVDSISTPTGSDWFTAGGFGVNYPSLSVNKWGVVPGETYRGQARTWCNPNAGLYRSAAWTSLVWWTQPNSIRISNPDSKDRKLVIITDLLGREVNPKKVIDNTTLFYIYSDGTVEKRIVIE